MALAHSSKWYCTNKIIWCPGQALSWLEHCPVHQKFAGSILYQGTHVGCRFSLWLGCVWNGNWSIYLSLQRLSLFLPPSSSLSKVSKHILGLGFSKIIRNNSCPQVVRIYGDVIKETKVFLFHSDNHETFFVKIASLYNFSEIAFSFYMS